MILKTVIYDDLVFCKNNLQYRYYIKYLMVDNNHQKNNHRSTTNESWSYLNGDRAMTDWL